MIADFIFVLRTLRKTKRTASQFKDSEDALIWSCLIDNDSYRLPATAGRDWLIGFRLFARTLKRWLREDTFFENPQPFDALILGGGGMDERETLEYLKKYSGHNEIRLLYRDKVQFSMLKHPFVFICFFFWGLQQALRTIFRERRGNHALLIATVCETTYILNILNRYNIDEVYDYLPYEVESNFLYSVFSKRGITLTKLPSAGPLSTHHSRTLADAVVITNAYHLEEIDVFGNSFRAGKILRWPPERSYKCIPKYRDSKNTAVPNTIGFYSHGQWLRNRLNHAQYGSAIEQDEIRILHYIRNVSKEFNSEVYLYLHPRELKAEIFPETKKFYEKHLAGISYEIKIHPDSTAMHFEEIDIAVAAFSTIVFERIYFGFKILIGTEAMPNFPVKGSPLNNICFSDYNDFRLKIIEANGLSKEDFFKKNLLESYIWNHFLND